MERDNLLVPYGSSEQLQNCYFNPNWDHSLDQNDPFESALSSMVSSPAASKAGVQGSSSSSNAVVRELTGRLGSICNSGEVSPQSYTGGNTSTTNSCYSTPLNSPPKLNLSMMENQIRENSGIRASFAPLPADPGFAERAARLSCFANKNLSGLNAQSIKISRSSTPENTEFGDSRENSSLSEQITGDANPRKRRAIPRGKAKEPFSANSTKTANAAAANDESTAKKSKSGGENGNESNEKDATKRSDNKDENKDDSKAPEPPKDYIHVRARRGQATDAHSLAERVRREKISERMKLLQDLVPGCNKVTGKAVMLDEIINYVQSLQRQVEFLSMKLSTINPRMDFNAGALQPKEVLLSHNLYQSETSAQGFAFPIQSQHGSDQLPFSSVSHLNAAIGRNQGNHLPHLDTFGESGSQVSSFWEDDLHSVVQMGFGQNQTQNFHGILPTSQMKIEN